MLKLSKISISIITFSLGITSGLYLMLFLFFPVFDKLSIQFDILSPISLILTIFLAIFVAEKLNISNEKTRVEKNLIIEDLKGFKKDINKNVKCISEAVEIEYTEASSKMKVLRMKINSILKLVEKYQFCKDVKCFEGIDNKIRDIKDLFTDQAKVENNKIILESIQKDQINLIINDIESHIFEVIVEINRK